MTVSLWLDNECFLDATPANFLKIVLEKKVIVREQEGPGEEVIVLWIFILEPIEILCEGVLAVKSVHSREMIDFLMWGHL